MGRRVSRRDFLKLGASAGALAVLGAGVGRVAAASPDGAGQSVSRTTGRSRVAVPTTCQLCHARCGILGFVEHDRLVKIEGNPYHPNNRGRICAKGQAGVNLLYDPDRLLKPLRRRGPRGSGAWEEISWDEAYAELAARLKDIRGNGDPDQFVFQAGTAATERFVGRFLRAFGTRSALSTFPHADYNKATAQELTWGAPIEVVDAAHTKYILNFGANPYEAHFLHVPLVQRLIEGRLQNSAKLVTFDVRLSNTAGRSDEWFPIRPGTDGLVALALANVIMNLGLHDEGFLRDWTNYPVEGLARHLSQYTPEMAEEVSGVRASDVRRLALEFATSRPGATLAGSGASMHRNGVQTERCIALLNAVTGNVDVRGGYCLPRQYEFWEPRPIPKGPEQAIAGNGTPVFSGANSLSPSMMERIASGEHKVGVYMIYMHNPVYSNPDPNLCTRILTDEKLVPLFVAVDTAMSESALLADIVLPDATYLERWDLESGPALDLIPFVALRQPVLRPRGQAIPFHDMCIELARRIGGGMEDYFKLDQAQDYLIAAIANIEELARAGGIDYLKEHGVWSSSVEPTYRRYQREGFRTPSGKIEIYSQALADRGFPPLPTFEPDGVTLGGDQLFLTTFKPAVLTTWMANAKWLSEIAHDGRILLNRETAQRLGIRDGGRARLSSPVGSFIGRVRLSEGVHPEVVAVAGGLGHWALGHVAQAHETATEDPDTRLLWWGEKGNGIYPNSVMPVVMDPAGGGQAWHGTPVNVEAV